MRIGRELVGRVNRNTERVRCVPATNDLANAEMTYAIIMLAKPRTSQGNLSLPGTISSSHGSNRIVGKGRMWPLLGIADRGETHFVLGGCSVGR